MDYQDKTLEQDLEKPAIPVANDSAYQEYQNEPLSQIEAPQSSIVRDESIYAEFVEPADTAMIAVPQMRLTYSTAVARTEATDRQLSDYIKSVAAPIFKFHRQATKHLQPLCREMKRRFTLLHKGPKQGVDGKPRSILGYTSIKSWWESEVGLKERQLYYVLGGGNPQNARAKTERKAKKVMDETARLLIPTPTGRSPEYLLPQSSTPTTTPDKKSSLAISHSPIDDSQTWAKEDAARRILSWTLSCIKEFSLIEKRQIVEEVIAKLRDEMEFEAADSKKVTISADAPNKSKLQPEATRSGG